MTDLSKEVEAALAEPVPAEQILTLPSSNVRYTTDKFVRDRLDRVVGRGNWSAHYTVVMFPKPYQKLRKSGDVEKTFIGSMICDLTVLGVTKGATTDIEFTDDMYGGPTTNAEATALKRAAKEFGVARELWKGTEAATAAGNTAPAARSNRTPASAPVAGVVQSTADPRPFRTPPDNVIKWLTDLHVPREIALGLNGAGSSAEPSQASRIITVLMDNRKRDPGYNDDPDGYVADALTMHAPDLLTANQAPVPAAAVRSNGATRKRKVRSDEEEDDE